MNDLLSRAKPRAVALETTLLLHGVPRTAALDLHHDLTRLITEAGAAPALIGVLHGTPVAGLTDTELQTLLDAGDVQKLNTANLGLAIHRREHGATTVSATMEIAAAAGIRLFATGGLGGVHHNLADRWDVSADLAALARFPVAVVASGVKSIIDVVSTREALETLGVTVVGFRTDAFPAFYLRDSDAGVDARFDDEAELAAFVAAELTRTGRGIVIANPIPEPDALDPGDFARWLDAAHARASASGARGRDVTPALLAALHELSESATLRANLALVRDNTQLAARIATRIDP